jgi:hypothetical protein
MNQDTIPSQLGPSTIPSALGPANASGREPEASAGISPAFKWLIGTLAAALLIYLARLTR